jgi:transposase
MDMSVFEEKYKNDETGCGAYDPKILLKVVLLGYSRGLISSRQIERLAARMWPLWRFRATGGPITAPLLPLYRR